MPEAVPARVLSVNVSLARMVPYRGGSVSTGIYKQPVGGRVHMGRLGLAGDEQADLRVHGGANKAVYAYPAEHYAVWRQELPGMALPWASSVRISRRAACGRTDAVSEIASRWGPRSSR